MLLQHRLDEITLVINGYQVQIEQLQNQISQLQAHAQKVGSVEAAMESAVAQLQTAIAMVNSVCPDELSGFSEVIMAQFQISADAPQLPAVEVDVTPVADEPTPAPSAPSAPSAPVDDAPSVEQKSESIAQPVAKVEVVTDANAEINPESADENSVLSQMQLTAVSKVRGKGKAFLKAMAVKYRISHNSRTTNEELITQLVGKVTRADVAEYKPVG